MHWLDSLFSSGDRYFLAYAINRRIAAHLLVILFIKASC
jgi:hypothetical protein